MISDDVREFALAFAPLMRLDMLQRTVPERIAKAEPELASDPQMTELLRACMAELLAGGVRVLETGTPAAQPGEPGRTSDTAIYVRKLAQRNIPVETFLRAYRVGQTGLFTEAVRAGNKTSRNPILVGKAMAQLSPLAFAHADRDIAYIHQEYALERERWLKSDRPNQTAAVLALLSDTAHALDADTAAAELDFPVDGESLGLILWDEGVGAGADGRLDRLIETAAHIAKNYGCSGPPLLATPDASTVWAWLPHPVHMGPSAERTVEILGDTSWVAVGKPRSGLAGFRSTHRQAAQAQAVSLTAASDRRRRLTLAADAGVVGLLCRDLPALRSSVLTTLGELAADDENSELLRETLRHFLAAGGSFVAAGQQLHLHKNTVQYRVRKAEQLLGHDLQCAHPHVEVALLACHVLGAAVLRR